MKINFFKIKKTFKKGGLHTNPDVYWNALQAVTLFLIIVAFALGFYLFNKINQKFTLSNEDSSNQEQALNKGRIDKILEYFSEKDKKSKEILNFSASIVDPSQ